MVDCPTQYRQRLVRFALMERDDDQVVSGQCRFGMVNSRALPSMSRVSRITFSASSYRPNLMSV